MKDNFLWTCGMTLAKMRLLIEGALVLFENDAAPVIFLARKNRMYEPANSVDILGGALYDLREYVSSLQSAHLSQVQRELEQDEKENRPFE